MQTIADAAAALEGRERILVFTGAGISTESGIPDFRGPNGVWKTEDPKNFTLRHYLDDEQFRRARWKGWFGDDRPTFRPNQAHKAVVDLWESGRMVGCVTQNIDGLHVAGGLPAPAIAEVHGNSRGIICVEHGHSHTADHIRSRWLAGDLDPHCECGSILKSTVVLFGEELPPAAASRARTFSLGADAAIAVGSTISVFPAADYLLWVADRGLPLIILNMGPTDADEMATVRLDGKAGDLLPGLVSALRARPA
ncbi:MAG: NAD-dependent deacetylase [bacterium]|nr:NAD-dependent deacetylase [bacterium]